MANTRPFTYNNGSPIDGNAQIGDLAFGNFNDVNGGPNYDNNPGGKKWWMGPDEDDRYVIGKDVPTEDWPTQIPEGDIGSVRFWATSTESDSEFIDTVNSLPARSGETDFIDTSSAYIWLINNGYWTNYPESLPPFAGWKTYRNPSTTTAEGNQIVYSSNRNTAYFDTNLPLQFGTQLGNFYATNFSSTITTGSTTDYQGDTTYLPTTTSSFGGDDVGQGYMVIDDTNNHLYVCFSGNRFGVIKYLLTNNTVLWSGPDPNNTQNIGGNDVLMNLDSSVDKLILYKQGDGRILFIDSTDGEGLGYGTNGGTSINDITIKYVIPGPSSRALVIRDGSNNMKIINTDTQEYVAGAVTLPSPFPSGGSSYITSPPVYISSKNKWYIPYRITSSNPGAKALFSNYLVVVNGDGTIDKTIKYGTTYLNQFDINERAFVHYDSSKDLLWALSPDGFLCIIDPDTGGQIIKTSQEWYDTSIQIGDILICRGDPYGLGVSFRAIDLSLLYPLS
jgi:hypothetical protein